MRLLLFVFLALPAACAAPAMQVIGLPVNDTASILSVLDTLPKECDKNGKKYKEGESFEIKNLRYKCQKYGVYSIEGCRTEKNESMEPGQSFVKDNILYQCAKSGSSVFYRETTCGAMGMPDCDKVPKPSGFLKAEKNKVEPPKGKKVNVAGLPEGWEVFEEGAKTIPGTNATIISRVLMFNGVHSRTRRQQPGQEGIGSVVGIEDPGTDKPPMPMEMLMGGTKVTKTPMKKEAIRSSKMETVHSVPSSTNKQKRLYTQDLGAKLEIRNPSSSTFKPGSVGGSRSDVNWGGKKADIHGKNMAVGPGTFTFGNHPTGAFAQKKATFV